MQPIGGRWNPRADFEQTVLALALSITPEQFTSAISAGDHFWLEGSARPFTPVDEPATPRRVGWLVLKPA